MEIEGEHCFEIARNALWHALFDPAALRLAQPAIESIDQIAEDTYELNSFIEIRGFWGRFRGLARVTDIVTPDSFHLRLSGAAAEGAAMGQGIITLSDNGKGTRLHYRGDVTVHGALTRLGGRFVGGGIRFLLRQLLDGLERDLLAKAPNTRVDRPS